MLVKNEIFVKEPLKEFETECETSYVLHYFALQSIQSIFLYLIDQTDLPYACF